ncbi:hypothetical protein JXA56_03070 [Candidatus Micrarchaeota archaeon]|nr:hypothetical protein [Candidatus Micrarchaeota archaeon]
MIPVNKEKLKIIIRASRRMSEPKAEGLDMDFDLLAKTIRKIIRDSYKCKFDIMKNNDINVKGIAASALFIKKAYEIIGIRGEGDEKVLKWAEHPDFEEEWDGKPSKAYSYIFDRLFSAIMEKATDGRDVFFAFQLLFDDAMEAGAGHIAKKTIFYMDQIPEADLEIFAADLLRYTKRIGENAFFDRLPKLFLRKEKSAFCRIVVQKMEAAVKGDEKTREKARNWLKHMEKGIGAITVQDKSLLPKDAEFKNK